MPYPNEHSARIKQPTLFKEKPDWPGWNKGKFARTDGGKYVLPGAGMIKIPSSIKVLFGQLKTQSGKDGAVQALRFPVSNWTSNEARVWLRNNKVKYVIFEGARK